MGRVVAVGQRFACQAEALDQFAVEAQFDRPHGDVLAVLRAVGGVVRCPSVDGVGAARGRPDAGLAVTVVHGHQVDRAVEHGGVNHLTLAGRLRFEQCSQHPHGEVHRTAGEIAYQVEGDNRRSRLGANGVEHPGQGNVVDVMACLLAERAVLAPAGHAAVDKARIGFLAGLGAQAKPFHDARAESLDQQVGGSHQIQHRSDAVRALQIDCHGAFTPIGQVEAPLDRKAQIGRREPVDTDHIRAHVGQQHPAKRRRPDAGHFHNPDSLQWSHVIVSVGWPRLGARPARTIYQKRSRCVSVTICQSRQSIS